MPTEEETDWLEVESVEVIDKRTRAVIATFAAATVGEVRKWMQSLPIEDRMHLDVKANVKMWMPQ